MTDGHAAQAQHDGPGGQPINERGRVVEAGLSDDQRTYALFMHLAVLAHAALPVVAILLPIVMWQAKKRESRFIDDHGREVTNFQITLLVYAVALPIATALIGVLTCGLGMVLVPLAALVPYALGLVGMVLGALAANRGEYYRYPMTVRFLRG